MEADSLLAAMPAFLRDEGKNAATILKYRSWVEEVVEIAAASHTVALDSASAARQLLKNGAMTWSRGQKTALGCIERFFKSAADPARYKEEAELLRNFSDWLVSAGSSDGTVQKRRCGLRSVLNALRGTGQPVIRSPAEARQLLDESSGGRWTDEEGRALRALADYFEGGTSSGSRRKRPRAASAGKAAGAASLGAMVSEEGGVRALGGAGGGRRRLEGRMDGSFQWQVASCAASDGPSSEQSANTSSEPASKGPPPADPPASTTNAQKPTLSPEQQAQMNKLMRDLCMTDKNKIFIGGLFASPKDGALSGKGGATGVGCMVPDLMRGFLGDKQLHVLGAAPGDLGRSTEDHVKMALACFKNLLPVLQAWGVGLDPDCDVFDRNRPILLYLGGVDCFKTSTSLTAAAYLAFVSRFTTLRFRRDTVCTGDLSLGGRVLRVGSLREKLSGAEEMGMTRVVVPRANFEDEEVVEFRSKYEKNESGLEVVAADDVVELINQCAEEGHGLGQRDMRAVYERVGQGCISLGPQGDALVECCVHKGGGRLRVTGAVARELEGDALTMDQMKDCKAFESLCMCVVSYVSVAQGQAWFAELPRGRRRYNIKTGMVTEDQADGQPPLTYRADLHIHLAHATRCMAATALTLAVVEVVLGYKATKAITSATAMTVYGHLLPAEPKFDTAVTSATYFVGRQVDSISKDYCRPEALPPNLSFEGFEHMHEVLCFAYNVSATGEEDRADRVGGE